MPAPACCLGVFLLWELAVAALIAFYIIYPCTWPLSQRESCLPLEVEQPCPKPPCLRKCCALGEELFKEPNKPSSCRPTENSSFSLEFVPLWGNDSLESNYTRYTVFSIGMCPHKMYKLDPSLPTHRHTILPDGILLLTESRKRVPHQMFCVDSYPGRPASVFRCFPAPKAEEMSEIQRDVFPLTLTVSLPFLVATAAVYVLLPKLRNLHGRCLLCYVLSLTVGSSFLVFVQANFFNLNIEHPQACNVCGE